MKLSKEHKKSFLFDFEETIKAIDLQERIINKAEKDSTQLAWHETELFLLQEKKRIIGNALINGEIDF